MAIYDTHPPLVTMGVPDNRLDHPGYVHRYYPHEDHVWDDSKQTDVWRWPKTKLITLKPEYDLSAAEADLSEWDTAGTNTSYIEVTGYREADAVILQQSPAATDCVVTSDFTAGLPDDNQSFVLDFYLLAVADIDWYAEVTFCTKFRLRLLYNGVLQLWRNYAVGEDAPDWRYCGSSATFDSAFNRKIRVWVYPTNQQMLLIWPEGFDPIQYIEPEAETSENIVNLGAPTEATYPLRTICPQSEIELTVTGGAFYASYRYIDWPTDGTILLPRTAKPLDDNEAFELEHSVAIPRAGYDFDVDFEVLDEDAVPLVPGNTFRWFTPRITFTNCDAACSPELYWCEFRVDPTSQVFVPVPPFPLAITEPGRLQGVRTQASYQGRHTVEVTMQNLDAALNPLADVLHICTSVVADGVTTWKGYLQRRAAPEEQTGSIEMNWEGKDPLDRLNVPLSDAYIGDGRIHNEYIEDLFQVCGLAPADYIITPDPDDHRLPQSVGQGEPYFRIIDGRTAREMIEYIGRVWSGWELYCTQDGIIHYAPEDTSGLPERTLYGYQSLAADALKYYAINPQRDEDRFYNYIVVIGQTLRGTPIIAVYYDIRSVNDPTDLDFLGYERLLMVVDSTLRTSEHVETALGYIVAWHGSPLEQVDVRAEFEPTVDVRSIVGYDGRRWQVRSIGRNWGKAGPDMNMVIRKVS